MSSELRHFIAEHPLTCCYTTYRLELEWPVQTEGTAAAPSKEVAVKKPASESAEESEAVPEGAILIDCGEDTGVGKVVPTSTGGKKRVLSIATVMPDITPYLYYLTRDQSTPTATVKIILENYDVRRARQHVRRLREVLVKPPVTINMNADAVEMVKASAEAESGAAAVSNEATTEEELEEAAARNAAAVESKTAFMTRLIDEELKGVDLLAAVVNQRNIVAAAKDKLPPVELPVSTDFSKFYPIPLPITLMDDIVKSMAADSDGAPSAASSRNKAMGKKPLPVCVKNITYSGWNPPPPHRRMMGM
jgi:hypothetical protein